ncbi:MAG: phosphoenolpyruvate carboxylase, partial [Candidatus Sericytochromatia bacterium]|nr:phosphoenolpyruvate carboxylase [Candidatus Sericytochromatia bacterium]
MRETLWSAVDQAARLAELISEDPRLKERPLRRDVRSLGRILGDVLKEQEGIVFLAAVEDLRRQAIDHRETSVDLVPHPVTMAKDPLLAQVQQGVHTMSVADAYRMTKAFATYFELTNLAETNHRKRRRRARGVHAGDKPQPGSFQGTLARMAKAGIDATAALAWLQQVEVGPVFTAHPTEVARRTVMAKRERIAEALEALDRLPLPERGAAERQEAIAAEITALWQTDEVRRRQPTVRDEIAMGLDYHRNVMIASLPELYEEMRTAFQTIYGLTLALGDLPTVVRFGSWIGGDRDGNPYVTPEVTQSALDMARRTIRDYYLQAVANLTEHMSPSTRQEPTSPGLIQALEHYALTLTSPDPSPKTHSPYEL